MAQLKSQLSPPTVEVDLKSEKGINYTKLHDLLAQQKWKEADYETYLCMMAAVGRNKGDYFRKDEIENFPSQDLHTIDQLWLKYSNGHFGLSVQQQIWLEVGAKIDYDTECRLADRVGWRKEGDWISYDSLEFSLSAPKGQLPYKFADFVGLRGFCVSSFASRLVECKNK